jgi:hypothetical protein
MFSPGMMMVPQNPVPAPHITPAVWNPQAQPVAATPAPRVRMQAPEEPPARPQPTTLPVPEPFGLAAPTIRMKSEEETRPAQPLSLPAPEQLGIAPPRAAAEMDWNDAMQRINRLAPHGFHKNRTSQGKIRVTLVLAAVEGVRHVEAEDTNEAAAVRAVLERAEALRR